MIERPRDRSAKIFSVRKLKRLNESFFDEAVRAHSELVDLKGRSQKGAGRGKPRSRKPFGQDADFSRCSLKEITRFQYPLRYSVVLDYYATGEGLTRGLLLGHADSPASIRRAVVRSWGSYLAKGVTVYTGWTVPPPYSFMLSAVSRRQLEWYSERRPTSLVFWATLHLNRA